MAEIRVNATGALKLYDNDDSHFVGLQAGSISSDVTFTLPTADGSNGQFMKTNGSGALSFGSVSSALDDITTGDAASTLATSAGNITIDAQGNDTDIIFKGTDGSADTTFLTIDGSDAGTLIANHNLELGTDASEILFGADNEVKVIHNADKGLILKHTATADDKPVILTLQTGETDMAANDVIGKIEFQAPDEGTGTDAVLVSGAIQAVAEGDHSSSSNATSLEFMTGASEAATTKIKITSAGHLVPASDNTSDLGTSSLEFKDGYFDGTLNADKLAMTVTNDAPNASGTTRVGSIALDGDNNGIFEMGISDGSFYAWLQATDKTDLSVNYPLALNANGGICLLGVNSNSGYNGSVFKHADGISVHRANATGNNGLFLWYSDEGSAKTNKGYVKCNGGIVNYQSNDADLSDERLKKNITDAPSSWNIIKNLKVRNYKYKTDDDSAKTHIGLIAQETETVDSSLVNTTDGLYGFEDEQKDEKYRQIYNKDLYFKMLKALQESITKIETLETEMTALKTRVKTLEDA